MNLSIASQIAFSLAAYEAQALKSKFIDSEHLFLGLCKVEDILTAGREAVQSISESDWQDACEEITHPLFLFLTVWQICLGGRFRWNC